jgi:hypothetical protein
MPAPYIIPPARVSRGSIDSPAEEVTSVRREDDKVPLNRLQSFQELRQVCRPGLLRTPIIIRALQVSSAVDLPPVNS